MRANKIIFVILLLPLSAHAQTVMLDLIFTLPDTVKPLTIEKFYNIILQNHPVVKQATLLSDVAKQEIRLARGNFDPELESSYLVKHYNGSE